MFNVSDYFKRLTKMEEGAVSAQDSILKAFKDVCGIEKIDFMIRKGTVVVTSNSIIKSIVFMKKKEVLEYLSRTSPSLKISDIR